MSEEKSQRRDAPRPVDRHKRTVTRRAGSVSRSRGVPAAATALLSPRFCFMVSSSMGTSSRRRPIYRSACDSIVSKLGLGGQLRCYRPPLAKRVRLPHAPWGGAELRPFARRRPSNFTIAATRSSPRSCRPSHPTPSPRFQTAQVGRRAPAPTRRREPARRGGRTGAGVAAAAVGRARKAMHRRRRLRRRPPPPPSYRAMVRQRDSLAR